jgi:hypothetical protein
MNKKAEVSSETMYWIWRFVLISIFAGGVILVLLYHYAYPFDVRDVESSILAEKIVNCIKPSLYFDEANLNQNLISSCPELSDNDNQNEIWVNITLTDFTKDLRNFEIGDSGLGMYFNEVMSGKKFSFSLSCNEYRYYVISKDGSQFIIDIKITIKKLGLISAK